MLHLVSLPAGSHGHSFPFKTINHRRNGERLSREEEAGRGNVRGAVTVFRMWHLSMQSGQDLQQSCNGSWRTNTLEPPILF